MKNSAMKNDAYDTDFYAWANEQAALLRSGRLAEADIANIAEEIETMGRAEKRELVSRLTILLVHLLKWRFQPNLRGRSWRLTIKEQRKEVLNHLADNPSLRQRLRSHGRRLRPRDPQGRPGDRDGRRGLSGGLPWTFDEATADVWPE